MPEKTVAAISTPVGEGGIGVIRISGDSACEIADRCFKAFSGEKLSSLKGYSAAYGEIYDSSGNVLDDAVALVFRAPKSFTGEETVEISLHGGRIIVKKALREILKCGAFAAGAGEFTKRAFLNGKLDLAKAESIMGLISAKNEAALRISRAVKDGRVSRKVGEITDRLVETAACLAAYSDFPDEDIPELSPDRFLSLLDESESMLSKLLSTFDAGKIVREGIECAIVGKPNVGKSTLMNMLCGSERSIVTDIAGTTRDVIENTVTLGDITLNLSDTAGIRTTSDIVEKAGVNRAIEKTRTSALILAVFDASEPLDDDDKRLLGEIRDKETIVILNKTDLSPVLKKEDFAAFTVVETSAKSGKGAEILQKEIEKITETSNLSPDDAVLITERQRDCAERAKKAVTEARAALTGGVTLDAVSVCVDDAVSALLELTGRRVTNEVTDEVFRRFCIGK